MTNNWQQLTLSATTALAIAAIAPSAQAMSLVPQEEGEVDVGLGCLTTCISLPNLITSIVSEVDGTTGARSRLFVDDVTGSANNYGSVNLNQGDIGTNSTGFWYRPVEETEEDGQLEVGTFTFTFKKTISELMIDFFDTEVGGQTGILEVNGQSYNSFVPNGGNGNIFTQTLNDVSSITLKLGSDFVQGTGDGVNFRIAASASVPEPASLLGLGAVAVLGAFGLRKRSV
ncbi:LEVG family PEP-CTERM protein [Roseofilum casamattae]|uniref:LEVG family PEP-CTERM protein n=1 Tax=Roseofilum casamattae BLCC-M143 TaxID=3022442 RepID=A0ABT7BSG2_9CYAN|nr:LEVG family PEP-CTERM protein [Roseofilum casamattae]MDJ1182129.1 LEVG family PEP-CTERM protein [Roseofilum casamattae BLCC-M143]